MTKSNTAYGNYVDRILAPDVSRQTVTKSH